MGVWNGIHWLDAAILATLSLIVGLILLWIESKQ